MLEEEEEKYDEDFNDLINDDNSIQSNSQDSFAKGISKAYEEHKKTESKINHRPISSYQVNNNNVVNNLNKEDSIKSKQKPQSAHPITSSNNSVNNKSKSISSKNEKEIESDKSFEEIITDLKNFIKQKNIKKSDFIDNENIFLTFEDFKTLLQSIHYIIPKQYAKVLFNYKNEGAKDNYIYVSKFLKYLYDDINESEISNSNISMSDKSIRSSNSSLNNIKNRPYSSKQINKNNNINNTGKNVYEMAFLNEQFSKFNKDIRDIIKFDSNKIYNYSNNSTKISKENNNFRKRPITGMPKSTNSSKINITSKPITLSKKNSLKSINTKLKEEEDYLKKELNKEEQEKKERNNMKNLMEKRKLEEKKENDKNKKIF